MDVLRVEKLKAFYIMESAGEERAVKAVNDVSLTVRENEVLGIAGESGCGKSTLLKSLLGSIRPPLRHMGGRVTYLHRDREMDILSLPKEERQKLMWQHISYVPQGSLSVLNPVRRIGDTFRSFVGAHLDIQKDPDRFESLVRSHLQDLGLPVDTLKAYPHQLSGGMRQRVTIALATILKPRLILADEPSTALDVVVQRGVIQLLRDIQTEQHNTIVMVTHDMAIHANISDRVAIMYAGRIIEEAPVERIFAKPLHPYTQYLIGSLPRIGDKSYRLSAPGTPPSLADLPPGCAFHPRCPNAESICRREIPSLSLAGRDHRVACFLAAKEDADVGSSEALGSQ
ncbi:MAG TPA: ABC transporter ATP-binding protein [Firmicutes bacterium]|nr:ABC transporter ATP-binding protein [Bacillota bacterium]